MSMLFSFCDCHWILPWILPFILGLIFGSRFVFGYKNRIRDLESDRLRENQRFASLEADSNAYKTQLEDNKRQTQARIELAENEKQQYEHQLVTLNQQLIESDKDKSAKESELMTLRSKLTELEATLALEKGKEYEREESNELTAGFSAAGFDTEAKDVEIDSLHSRIADLEQELAAEKSKKDLTRNVPSTDDVVGESARSVTDLTELRQQLLSTQEELRQAKSNLEGQDSVKNELDDSKEINQLRSQITALEADLALSKGKEYESKEAESENPEVISLRKRLLEAEAKNALAKNESEDSNYGDSTLVNDLRTRLLETEAELALAKGEVYEGVYVESGKSQEELRKQMLSLEAELALEKGKSYEVDEQNKLASATIQVQQKPSSTKKKSSKKSLTKSKKKTSKKEKAEKKKQKSKSKPKVNKSNSKSIEATSLNFGFTPDVVSSVFKPAKDGKFSKIKEGDLTVIEGIGPKTAKLLQSTGIKSWADLAAKSPSQLKELLSAKKSFAHIDPSTWTRQANLAAGNHWTRLANLQDELDGGKRIKKTKKKKTKRKGKTKKSKASTKKLSIKLNSKLKNDNFQLIEGVGPKMNSLLLKEGIKSWTDLASHSPGEIKELLNKHGDKYKIIDAKTWSKQASYASKGQWDKLVAYQKKDGSDSKAEKLLGKMGILKSVETTDLKIVEGVGPKIESLLKKAGIQTLGDLSKATKTKLKKILEAAGSRYSLADPTHWAKQASLANTGKLAELKKFQDSI